jgi:hypothetical protein
MHTPNLSRRALVAAGALAAVAGGLGGLVLASRGTGAPAPVALAASDRDAENRSGPTAQATVAAEAAVTATTGSPSPAPGGQATFAAADAGTVTLERTPTGLRVVSADAAAGWSSEIERPEGREVEVTFRSATRRVDFNAELEDGEIRVRVRERPPAPATTPPTTSPTSAPATTAPTTTVAAEERTISAGEAGSVTVAVVDGALELRRVDAAAGWTAEVEERSAHEVEVEFRRGDDEVEVKVELDDGELRVRVRSETGTDDDRDNSGPGSVSSGSDGRHHDGDGDGRGSGDDHGD